MIDSETIPAPPPEVIPTVALRRGDEAAFDRLYDQFAPRVMGFVLRLTGGNRAVAEDLTQDTFLAAFVGRGSYGGRAQPLPWLLGIAWRRWRDGVRHEANAPVTEPIQEETLPAADPTDSMATTIALRSALNRLPPDLREAIALTAVQGLTYAEAARVLGTPVGTIKWRVHEGTRTLRRLLTAAEERYEATETTTDTRRSRSRSTDPARCR